MNDRQHNTGCHIQRLDRKQFYEEYVLRNKPFPFYNCYLGFIYTTHTW